MNSHDQKDTCDKGRVYVSDLMAAGTLYWVLSCLRCECKHRCLRMALHQFKPKMEARVGVAPTSAALQAAT